MKKIAVLTSGGDAPGMNCAIRAVTRVAMKKEIEVYGITGGYKGLVEGNIFKLEKNNVSEILNKGGTILGSSRLPEFKNDIVVKKGIDQLHKIGIEGLIVIGGDGSYRGATAVHKMGMPCIGIPGTIDNDINGTDKTIGFHTALYNIVDAVNKLRDTSSSHHRCFIVEVMGRQSGQLAVHAGIACGSEMVITKDRSYNTADIVNQLVYEEKVAKKKHAIIIVSENILDVYDLAKDIDDRTGYSGRALVLGHIQRGGTPVPEDRILASKMGMKAVELLVENKSGECVCVKKDTIVSMDIEEALREENNKDTQLYKLFEELV
ncbi:MAG: 6-phosphofructokinase [Coprobacillaceae bacterium]